MFPFDNNQPQNDIPVQPVQVNQSPFESPQMTEAGAKYFMDITTIKAHRDQEEVEQLRKRIRPEILNLNRLLFVHPALANLEIESIQTLRFSFDKKVMLVVMFLDRNTITSEEYDYIQELKDQYYLMLTRAFGEHRERLTQATNTNVNLTGASQSEQTRNKGGFMDYIMR